jgi:hypothetical protein
MKRKVNFIKFVIHPARDPHIKHKKQRDYEGKNVRQGKYAGKQLFTFFVVKLLCAVIIRCSARVQNSYGSVVWKVQSFVKGRSFYVKLPYVEGKPEGKPQSQEKKCQKYVRSNKLFAIKVSQRQKGRGAKHQIHVQIVKHRDRSVPLRDKLVGCVNHGCSKGTQPPKDKGYYAKEVIPKARMVKEPQKGKDQKGKAISSAKDRLPRKPRGMKSLYGLPCPELMP